MGCHEMNRVLQRDLLGLERQLHAYDREADLWERPAGVANPGGNLMLHLTGNLQHFVGAVLGGTGYVRDRDAEFAGRDVPRQEIQRRIEAARQAVGRTLAGLDDAALDRPYPVEVAGVRPTTGVFLTHLVAHFAYHLGQIDVHRRLVTGNAASAGAMSIPDLIE